MRLPCAKKTHMPFVIARAVTSNGASVRRVWENCVARGIAFPLISAGIICGEGHYIFRTYCRTSRGASSPCSPGLSRSTGRPRRLCVCVCVCVCVCDRERARARERARDREGERARERERESERARRRESERERERELASPDSELGEEGQLVSRELPLLGLRPARKNKLQV